MRRNTSFDEELSLAMEEERLIQEDIAKQQADIDAMEEEWERHQWEQLEKEQEEKRLKEEEAWAMYDAEMDAYDDEFFVGMNY